MMLRTIDECLLCHRTQSRRDAAASHSLALPAPFEVRTCSRCGLRWLNPQPSDADYRAIYGRSYFGRGQAQVGPSGHWLLDEFPAQQGDYEAGTAAERLASYQERLRCLPRPGTNGRALDIGAATGDFLALARCRGWQVEGLEASAYACRRAQEKHGISLVNTSLEEFQPSHGYDLIHMSHVLEHFTRPDFALAKVRDMLLPGGMLVIEVPNQFDAWVNRLRRLAASIRQLGTHARPSVHSIHHTYFFRLDHVKRLMDQQGLLVCSERTFFAERLRETPGRRWLLRPLDYAAASIADQGENIEVIATREGQ
jgi:SAM-dependent methyltransferase